MEPQIGDSWEQQQSQKDLQREVKRQGHDLEWTHDALKSVREQVQKIDEAQWIIRGWLALLVGGLIGFAAIFGFVMGSMFPWFGR